MDAIAQYVDRHFDRFVEEVCAVCRYPTVSAHNTGLADCAEHLERVLKELSFDVRIMPMGGTVNPPLVYGRLNSLKAGRTVLLYGHYDVQPVEPLEAWHTPPFEPTIRDGALYGRGTNDDKGQFFAHLKAIEAMQAVGGGVPTNIILVLDPQEEIGTPRMADFVRSHLDLFRADFGFAADGEAASGNRIMMTFGNRGDCYVTVRFRTAGRDMHSGLFGGTVPNAAWRLHDFLETLRDENGHVLIDGFYDNVVSPSREDLEAAERMPYDPHTFREELGIKAEAGPKEWSHWEKIMFRPTCEISGLTAGYQGPGAKTVIPCEASAKIDMRLVKKQTPPEILEKFKAHARRHGFDDMEIEEGNMYYPSRTSVSHPSVAVIRAAVQEHFGQDPLLNPVIGGSNPSYVWNEIAGVPMIEVSYAQADGMAHAPNERFSLDHFRKGILTSARVFTGLAKLPGK